MITQPEFDFCQRRQNSEENQAILELNKPKLNRHCRVLLAAFERGLHLTVADGIKGVWDYENNELVHIGDLRARCRDLIAAGYAIKKEMLKGGYKEYYLSND